MASGAKDTASHRPRHRPHQKEAKEEEVTAEDLVIVTAVFCAFKDKPDTCTFEAVAACTAKLCGKLSCVLPNPDQLAIANRVWSAVKKIQAPPCQEDDSHL